MSKRLPPNLLLSILLTLPPPVVGGAPRGAAGGPTPAEINGTYPGVLTFKCSCTANPRDPFVRGRANFGVSSSGTRFTIYIASRPKFMGQIGIKSERDNVLIAELTFDRSVPQGFQLPQGFGPITVTITKDKDTEGNNVIKVQDSRGVFKFLPPQTRPV